MSKEAISLQSAALQNIQDLMKVSDTSNEELLQLLTYIRDSINANIEALDGNILDDYLKIVEKHYFIHTVLADYTDEEIFKIALFIIKEIYKREDLTEDNCRHYEVDREEGKIDIQFFYEVTIKYMHGYTIDAGVISIPFKEIIKYRT